MNKIELLFKPKFGTKVKKYEIEFKIFDSAVFLVKLTNVGVTDDYIWGLLNTGMVARFKPSTVVTTHYS